MERMHASAVAFGSRGLLIVGASGSGKSSLALELMSHGAILISDDQTELFMRAGALWARAPGSISGTIEARGLGLLQAEARPAPIVAVVDLDRDETDRLPPKRSFDILDAHLPLFLRVDHRAWPAALVQYLRFGRSDIA
ncbi:MAG: HPr kinase/phosphatase C-terminal domain-containing protein [Pseudomonadota bacterium]